MKKNRFCNAVLWQYFFITYLVILVNNFGYLYSVNYIGTITPYFIMTVYLTYSLIYLLPVFLLLFLLNRTLSFRVFTRLPKYISVLHSWFIYSLAVLVFTLVQILIYADKMIFQIYGFHLNGFVWNLVFTPGGLESLGGGRSSIVAFASIIVGFLTLQILLLVLILSFKRIQTIWRSVVTRPVIITSVVLYFIMFFFQGITLGLSSLRGYTPVLAASKTFPLYQPITFRGLAKSLGCKISRDKSFRMKADKSLQLHYPLKDPRRDIQHKTYNIVWLVAESLRADMIDPEIMPATWGFAKESSWFQNHHSGGNGTRMGMFTMFYGLYGNYWFTFLDERRGPLIMDLLVEDNYQLNMFTSAKFTYPEFDKTIFTRVPKDQLHESSSGSGWERDRKNISQMLDFFERRDPSRPFMTFMFFESPHAKYYFPAETIIRQPYLEDLNYANMDLKNDITLIKNRYINSCNHLDTQINRVVRYLEDNELMDSTIVLITGDHGEEFMEKGHWGHGSAFTEEQVHVPLILWIPGKPPQKVTAMTSHLDMPATLLPLLGVYNPPEDYSLGYDLFGARKRTCTVLSDWNNLVYMDQDYTAIFPLKIHGVAQQEVTTKEGSELISDALFYNTRKTQLLHIMAALEKFSRH